MKKVSFILSIVWPIVVIGLFVWSVVLHYVPKPATPASAYFASTKPNVHLPSLVATKHLIDPFSKFSWTNTSPSKNELIKGRCFIFNLTRPFCSLVLSTLKSISSIEPLRHLSKKSSDERFVDTPVKWRKLLLKKRIVYETELQKNNQRQTYSSSN